MNFTYLRGLANFQVLFIGLILPQVLSQFANASDTAAMIYDMSNRQFVGSAVEFCSSSPSLKVPTYFFTAAHVVERLDSIGVRGTESKVVYIDPTIDFALLERKPNLYESISPQHCLPTDYPIVARQVLSNLKVAPSTFHLSPEQRQASKVWIEIDGIDPVTLKTRRELFLTPLVLTTITGVPGRDQMGSLLQFEAKLIPGVSGSIISVFMNPGSYEPYGGPVPPNRNRWRPRPIGLVTIVSPEQGFVGALSLETVADRLRPLKEKLPYVVEPAAVSVSGGVRYRRSQIVHLRSNRMGSSGVGFQNVSPAGVSRGGDGGTSRGGDGGVSRGGDGGSGGTLTERSWNSGIVFPESPRLRWLDLVGENFRWMEHEPFNEKTWLQTNQARKGIYEQDGRLYRTSVDTGWPSWINPKFFNVGSADLPDGCVEFRANRWIDPQPATEPNGQVRLKLCLETTRMSQKIKLFLFSKQSEQQILNFQMSDAGVGQPLLETATGPGGQPIQRLGLRTFQNSRILIEIDWSTGITIELRPSAQPGKHGSEGASKRSLIVGPTL